MRMWLVLSVLSRLDGDGSWSFRAGTWKRKSSFSWSLDCATCRPRQHQRWEYAMLYDRMMPQNLCIIEKYPEAGIPHLRLLSSIRYKVMPCREATQPVKIAT